MLILLIVINCWRDIFICGNCLIRIENWKLNRIIVNGEKKVELGSIVYI